MQSLACGCSVKFLKILPKNLKTSIFNKCNICVHCREFRSSLSTHTHTKWVPSDLPFSAVITVNNMVYYLPGFLFICILNNDSNSIHKSQTCFPKWAAVYPCLMPPDKPHPLVPESLDHCHVTEENLGPWGLCTLWNIQNEFQFWLSSFEIQEGVYIAVSA